MAPKRGLGRGLDSLIPDNLPEIGEKKQKETKKEVKEEKAVGSEVLLSINNIEPNRDQPRKVFVDEALNELADSIKQIGIIEPLIVQKKKNSKRYEIIAGERRFRAARIAGLKEVPVVIRDYAEKDKLTIAILENIQREDLNPIETAVAYKQLMDELELTQEQVAEKLSKSRTVITNSIRLLNLPEEIQNMLAAGVISEGHGKVLLGLDDKETQIAIAAKISDEKLSVRAAEELIRKLKDAPAKDNTKKNDVKKKDASYRAVEEKLKNVLGTKVEIKKKTETAGQINISYYSIDELDRIIEILENQ